MASVIAISGLSVSTTSDEIVNFFDDVPLRDECVHLVGGENGDAFLEIETQDDVRRVLIRDGNELNGCQIKMCISTQSKMNHAINREKRNSTRLTNASLSTLSLNNIKSLELICEWENCNQLFTDRSLYLSHINKTHVRIFGSTSVTKCRWQGCFEEADFQNMDQFKLHLSFHAYHNQLMFIGQKVVESTVPKPTCYMDSSTKNVLVDISSVLLCGWIGCAAEFFDAESFFIHVDTHATEDVDIPMMSKEKLKKVRYAHCKWVKCDAAFKTKSHLKNHLRSHTQKKVIACPVCGVWFCNRNSFLNHCYRQETPTDVSGTFANNLGQQDSDDEEEGMLTIDEDANPSSIVIHLPPNLQNIIPSQTVGLINSNAAVSTSEGSGQPEENIVLSNANAIVSDQNVNLSNQNVALLVNFNLVNNDQSQSSSTVDPSLPNNIIELKLAPADDIKRPFQCTMCNKSFNTKVLLKEHMSKHIRQYKCTFCAYATSSSNHLKEHILFRHSDSANYKCQFCGQKFKVKRFLHRHIELHDSSKKFICDLCDKSFTNYNSLNRHVRIIHIEENIVFACTLCSKVYNRGSNLSRHLITTHQLRTASGFSRFIYEKNNDGVYRLKRNCYTVSTEQN